MVLIAPSLPIAPGPVTLTIAGSAYTAGTHQLEIRAGGATASATWTGTENWEQTVMLDTGATSVDLALLPAAAADGIELDHVQWTRPVALHVDSHGATFAGEPGTWRYELRGMTDDQALYNVTDPAQPVQIIRGRRVRGRPGGVAVPRDRLRDATHASGAAPHAGGTTIDERLVLHGGGGAIATWGPTGLSIAHGHDALQRGFYRALWSKPVGTATLGELTLAGYRELFLRGSCCQDTLRTFALLGDPLTRARVQALERVWVPSVGILPPSPLTP